jgi:hypothetical protein
MRIAGRFNGPPGSANGGVTAGRLAAYVGAAAVEVTLRRPPPLDVDLRVEASGGSARLLDGDVLVAEAVPSSVEVDAGAPVGVEQAAATVFPGRDRHPYPTCFVCGTERSDGLAVHPGPLGDGRVAGVWTPASDDPVLVWAALDCPGGWASDLAARPLVLGRMALERHGDARQGEPHVVVGWTTGGRGPQGARRHRPARRRRDPGGVTRATWLALAG